MQVSISKYGAGTSNYKFTATDISGKTATATGQFVVYDKGVKQPTISENTNTGKTVTIKNNESNGTIYYSVNGSSNSSSRKSSVTLNLTKEGTL